MIKKLYINFIKMKVFKVIRVFVFVVFGLLFCDFIMYLWFNFSFVDVISGFESKLVTEDEVYKSVLEQMSKKKFVVTQQVEPKRDINLLSGWIDDFYPLSKETRNATISFACCGILWGLGIFLKYHGY